jgi:hypothetical protein
VVSTNTPERQADPAAPQERRFCGPYRGIGDPHRSE